MSTVTMKQLLEAGVHFGHQTKRWNPKMKEYIFGSRNGIYIIDLQKTVRLFKEAYKFIAETAAKGDNILFVGTKKQAQDSILEESQRAAMFCVNQRWLGGTLTNFRTIRKNIERLKKLEAMRDDGTYETLPKKEPVKTKVETPPEKVIRETKEEKKVAAEPAPKKEPAAPPSVSDRGEFTIQVSSFTEREKATDLVSRLIRKKYPAYITSIKISQKTWYRVRVGHFTSREEAEEFALILKEKEKLSAFVTPSKK